MGAPRKGFKEHYARLDTTDPEACWPWPGSLTDGYGQLTTNYVHHRAHKYIYEHVVGPVPEGLVLDHLCHIADECAGGPTCQHRRCCNPTHMTPVSHQDNLLRGNTLAARNNTKTHCVNGHEFTEENTFHRRGARECRECMRIRARQQARKKSLGSSKSSSSSAS